MGFLDKSQYIRSIALKRDKIDSFAEYPFCLPVVRSLSEVSFHPKVTFIIGENGSGKSTLLEALAVCMGFNPEGGSRNFNFATHASHSPLHEYLRVVKGVKQPRTGFFLRAESFYNVATEIERLDSEMGGPRVIDSFGGTSLHAQSHGESFFALLQERFGPNGLYILDEPEAALSPQRQMAAISRIHQLAKQDCQFIIATHSPIILSYPDSCIFELQDSAIEPVEYEQTAIHSVTKQFLNNHRSMLKILLEE
jgi:predicted ATPase